MAETLDKSWEALSPDVQKGASALSILAALKPEHLQKALQYLKSKGPTFIDQTLEDKLRPLFDHVEHGA